MKLTLDIALALTTLMAVFGFWLVLEGLNASNKSADLDVGKRLVDLGVIITFILIVVRFLLHLYRGGTI